MSSFVRFSVCDGQKQMLPDVNGVTAKETAAFSGNVFSNAGATGVTNIAGMREEVTPVTLSKKQISSRNESIFNMVTSAAPVTPQKYNVRDHEALTLGTPPTGRPSMTNKLPLLKSVEACLVPTLLPPVLAGGNLP